MDRRGRDMKGIASNRPRHDQLANKESCRTLHIVVYRHQLDDLQQFDRSVSLLESRV